MAAVGLLIIYIVMRLETVSGEMALVIPEVPVLIMPAIEVLRFMAAFQRNKNAVCRQL